MKARVCVQYAFSKRRKLIMQSIGLKKFKFVIFDRSVHEELPTEEEK